jgi:hypothetical protein
MMQFFLKFGMILMVQPKLGLNSLLSRANYDEFVYFQDKFFEFGLNEIFLD